MEYNEHSKWISCKFNTLVFVYWRYALPHPNQPQINPFQKSRASMIRSDFLLYYTKYYICVHSVLIFVFTPPPRPLSIVIDDCHWTHENPGTNVDIDGEGYDESITFDNNPLDLTGAEGAALAALGVLGLLTFLPSCTK